LLTALNPNMIHFETIDTSPQEEIQSRQDALLAEAVSHCYLKSPYYKRVFDKHRVSPAAVKGCRDLQNLPFTAKEDIQADNDAFFAVSSEGIAEIVSTTGTTGDPVFVALTETDLERLACNEERNFRSAGARSGDLYHLAVTCDNLFIAGLAYLSGLRRLGVSVARVGPQNILRHLDLMKRLRPVGLVAVPSFVLAMARRMKDTGMRAAELGLERVVLIGDSIRDAEFETNALGKRITEEFGDIFVSTYGITEAQLSFCECEKRLGLHSHPDFVLVEVVDEQGRPLPDGEVGELVLTTLQVAGTPLLRYKTGDMTFKLSAPCPCGRNSVRIGHILGRKHQKLKIKGVTLYPKNIENALLEIQDIVNYQIEAFTGQDLTDDLILRVGSRRRDEVLFGMLRESLLAKARITPKVEIEAPEEIEKRLFEGGSRKAVTFKDRRGNGHA
jgi:phenylacetate-CoA ligase